MQILPCHRSVRSRFARAGSFAAALLAANPLAAAIYDYTVDDGSGRALRLNIPDDLTTVRGILSWGNGGVSDSRGRATNSEFVAFAGAHGFCVLATAGFAFYVPGTYQVYLTGIERLAAMSGHAELTQVPWLPLGHSNGGIMSFDLGVINPGRTISFAVTKASGFTSYRPGSATLATPGLLIAGELDTAIRLIEIRDVFEANRPRGGLWAWVEEDGIGHSSVGQDDLIQSFNEEVLNLRYPDSQPVGDWSLRPVNEASGWLVEPLSYKDGWGRIYAYADYPGDRQAAGWLPSRRIAYIFRAFASYHKTTATLSSGVGPVEWGAPITYTINSPAAPWIAVEIYEGDTLLKCVTPGEGAALSLTTTPSAPGYSVYHAVIAFADGTQRTTEPRRVFVLAGTPRRPAIRALTVSAANGPGGTAIVSPAITGYPEASFRWCRNGTDLSGATAVTLVLRNVQPADAGLYALTASNALGSATSDPAVVGLLATSKVAGAGLELRPADISHPNGNTFDQILLNGIAETITADANQVTRTSFVDLNDDIVQVEFSGAGTLSLVLDDPSGPAAPANYHQPGVAYMKGHAGIVITGANETTNVAVFTVGRATAFDPSGAYNFLQTITAANNPTHNGSPLFQGHTSTAYDGVADLAFIAIASANGKFGSLRAADAACFATKGIAGIYAPGVQFAGPVFVSDINASAAASAMFVVGASPDTRIAGGDLQQANGQPVKVAGLTQLKFTAGANSHGVALPAQANRAVLLQDGADVTAQVVVNPTPSITAWRGGR